MIPAFNISNVLPPFTGVDPTVPSLVSPYDVTMTELATRFGTSPERIDILKGLLSYRTRLRQLNITSGFQLIDGSFVENCEAIRGRAPSDVDIVTFASLNIAPSQIQNVLQGNMDVFDPRQSKATYKCDAYFVQLDISNPQLVASNSFYWFGLFSHQRASNLWKGMLRVPIISDDSHVSFP